MPKIRKRVGTNPYNLYKHYGYLQSYYQEDGFTACRFDKGVRTVKPSHNRRIAQMVEGGIWLELWRRRE